MEDFTFVSEGTTRGKLFVYEMRRGSIPWANITFKDNILHGELYRVDPHECNMVDSYHDKDLKLHWCEESIYNLESSYIPKMVDVTLNDTNVVVQAIVFYMPQLGEHEVMSGDYNKIPLTNREMADNAFIAIDNKLGDQMGSDYIDILMYIQKKISLILHESYDLYKGYHRHCHVEGECPPPQDPLTVPVPDGVSTLIGCGTCQAGVDHFRATVEHKEDCPFKNDRLR